MKLMRPFLAINLIFVFYTSFFSQASPNVFTYFGMCDGSTATAINEDTFVVASDETKFISPPLKKGENVLNIYQFGNPQPVYSVDLEPALKTNPEDNEADIEGSARIGNRIFWTSSHGLNKNGKLRTDRLNFFATDIVDGKVTLASKNGQVLPSYKKLLDDLLANNDYVKLGLADLRKINLAPENGGFNIEGLSATPEGKILIAFRSPVIEGKALIAVLENPNDVIEGKTAIFGKPIQLKLDGLGIRDIAYWEKEKVYLFIAGSIADSNEFYLYHWNGKSGDENKPKKLEYIDFTGFNPETITIFQDGKVMILSDDGGLIKAGKNGKSLPNKELTNAERTFRGVILSKISDFVLTK